MRENKTNTNKLLFEGKFLFLQARKEEEFWRIPTPIEKGTAEEESLKREFDRYYTPQNLEAAINHPSQVVHGARDRMMRAVGGLGILSSDSILNNRVDYRLQNFYQLAPEAYKQVIDQEMRRIGGPGVDVYWGRPERKRLERRVAAQFFTYSIPAGGNYGAFLRTISGQIRGLGRIGGNAFVDSRGNPINVGNPFATSEFDVATLIPPAPLGPNPTLGNETVVVRWHQDDFITIKTKLERAGVWADFSRQGNAREFIHLKFRHSLIDQTIREEAAKLSADKYNPQRLTTWLENDLTAQAFGDDLTYRTWITGTFLNLCRARGVNNATDLNQRRNVDLLNMLKKEQNEARDRIRLYSLENQLKKILTPLQLENVHSSKETKTMLAYLFYKLHTPKYAEQTRVFIKDLSGIKPNTEKAEKNIKKINEIIEELKPILETYDDTMSRVAQVEEDINVVDSKLNLSPTGKGGAQQIQSLQQEKRTLEKERFDLRLQLAKNILNLRKYLEKNKDEELIKNSLTPPTQLDPFLTHTELQRFPATPTPINIQKIIEDFGGIADIFTILKNISTNVKTSKETSEKEIETANKHTGETKYAKMDSRGLLYKLIEHDLNEKGVTEQTGIQAKAHLTTNLLMADCRNGEIYANVNQKIASALEKSGIRVMGEQALSMKFFTPIMSGQDAIEHIVDTDPDLAMFKNIQFNSTRKDFLDILNRYGPIPPAKIREFIEKLAEVIRGIEVERKPGMASKFMDWIGGRKKPELVERIRVLDQDVPHIENLINLLTLLETQLTTDNFIKEIETTEEFEPGTDRNKLALEMLETQSKDSRAQDKSLANALEGHDAEFKKFFNKAELDRIYNEKMDEIEGLPREEQIKELEKIGITERVASRGIISVKTKRRLRKGGWAALKYGPLSWPVYAAIGVGKGAKWFGGYAKSILWTPESKAKADKIKAMYRGAILEPAWKAVTWPVAIGGYVISRPKTWLGQIEGRVMGGKGGH